MGDKYDPHDEYEDLDTEDEDEEEYKDGNDEWLTRRMALVIIIAIICFTIICTSEISEGNTTSGCSIKSTPYEESSMYSAEKTLPGNLPWDCHCKDAGLVAACSCKMRSP